MADPKSQSPVLGYSITPGRRITWRQLIKVLLIIVLLAVSIRIGLIVKQYASRQMLHWEWQSNCFAFNPAADAVMYAENKDVNLAIEAHYGPSNIRGGILRGPLLHYRHNSFPDWARYEDVLEVPQTGGATLFLGGRSTKSGRRLIGVDLNANEQDRTPALRDNFEVQAVVVEPMTFFTRPRCKQQVITLAPRPDVSKVLTRFYAGQPDPDDPSRFSIRYAVGGVEGHIDGQLNDDDSVALTIRDGPLKPPN